MREPIPKPVPRFKEPKPLQRKTELRPFKVDKNGMPIINRFGARVRVMVDPQKVERRLAQPDKPKKKDPWKKWARPDGEQRSLWVEVKQAWLIINPPDYDGDYYQCALCPYAVHVSVITLDHIKPKGTHIELKYILWNLQAAHFVCNVRKGSMSMEHYLARGNYPFTARVNK